LDEISLELPLKSEPVILQHITAYKLYKELDKEKKRLMAGYRAVKNHKKDLESEFNSQKVRALERKKSRSRNMGKNKVQREREKEKLKKWR
jgi:dynactin complex subunit